MTATIVLHEALSPDIVRLEWNGDMALWTSGKQRKDSPRPCKLCLATIPKGEESFRPVGNQLYRYERLHRRCLISLSEIQAHEQPTP